MKRTKRTKKRKTLDLNESLECEAFVEELEEDVKSKKVKRTKDAKKTFYNEPLELQRQPLKLLEESEKQFKHFNLQC